MREHQIVITLKPDQFLEVQRLARAANAKSMGVYVRQKLLAALGIEGTLQSAEQAPANVDLDEILTDLQRLHGELKSFVAESLSPYSPEAFVTSESPDHDDSAQLGLFSEDELISHAVAALEADDLEKVAQKAFAISPRLGPIGDEPSIPPTPPTPAPSVMAPDAVPAVTDVKTPELLARHELHYRRDSHRNDHASINESEEIPDPLAKLLSSDELATRPTKPQVELEADDDSFDVPLSIAERRRMMANGELVEDDEQPMPATTAPPRFIHPALQPTSQGEMPAIQESHVTAAIALAEQQAIEPTAASLAENDVQNSSAALNTNGHSDENGATTASPANQPMQNDPDRPLGYPPISGNPPPKRRQV